MSWFTNLNFFIKNKAHKQKDKTLVDMIPPISSDDWIPNKEKYKPCRIKKVELLDLDDSILNIEYYLERIDYNCRQLIDGCWRPTYLFVESFSDPEEALKAYHRLDRRYRAVDRRETILEIEEK
jgi:hypothetical protein